MITINKQQARVCIDPGHGGADSGAVGPNGEQEKTIALAVSKELMFQLECEGIDSHLTRTSDDDRPSLSERVAESQGDDCFISIHCNAATPQAEGIESIFSSVGGKHKALANVVQQALISQFPSHKNRGIKMSPSMGYPRKLYVLSEAKVPAVLVELEFISHPEQVKFLLSEENQKAMAHALCQGIKSFLLSLPGADGGKIIPPTEEKVLASKPEPTKESKSVSFGSSGLSRKSKKKSKSWNNQLKEESNA